MDEENFHKSVRQQKADAWLERNGMVGQDTVAPREEVALVDKDALEVVEHDVMSLNAPHNL